MPPLTAFLLCINLIGVITRSAPQLNLFHSASPSACLVFSSYYFCGLMLGGAMDELSHSAIENIQFVLGAMRDG